MRAVWKKIGSNNWLHPETGVRLRKKWARSHWRVYMPTHHRDPDFLLGEEWLLIDAMNLAEEEAIPEVRAMISRARDGAKPDRPPAPPGPQATEPQAGDVWHLIDGGAVWLGRLDRDGAAELHQPHTGALILASQIPAVRHRMTLIRRPNRTDELR